MKARPFFRGLKKRAEQIFRNGPTAEVLIAQTEKYMLLEKEEMLNRIFRKRSDAELRDRQGSNSPLDLDTSTLYDHDMDELIRTALKNS
jgi:hypothetical protein